MGFGGGGLDCDVDVVVCVDTCGFFPMGPPGVCVPDGCVPPGGCGGSGGPGGEVGAYHFCIS